MSKAWPLDCERNILKVLSSSEMRVLGSVNENCMFWVCSFVFLYIYLILCCFGRGGER